MEVLSIREYRHINFKDRKRIEEMYNNEDLTVKAIALEIGIHRSSVYREIKKGELPELNSYMKLRYSAVKAHNASSKVKIPSNVRLEEIL